MGISRMVQLESDSVIEKSIKIPFDFQNVPKDKNAGDSIVITPITVRSWFRLKPLLIKIEKEDIDKLVTSKDVEFNLDLQELMIKYDDVLFEIVCIGIHNQPGDMADWFKEVLKDSCTWEDIYILLNAILYRLGATNFLNSITALKDVSPIREEEIIALQKNKEKWGSKASSLF